MAELNIQFGQTPFWAICRFGEISKIEIIVFSFICAKRFRNNETADCARSEIIEYTKLDKSQISVAINKLKSINWLSEKSKTKWFIPETEPAKVEKSSTKFKPEKVVESSTKVVDSSTKVVESSTAYKESSHSSHKHTKNIVELRPTDSPELSDFRKNLSDFQDAYAKPTTKNMAIANTNAIRKLFDLAKGDPDICKAVHESLQAEDFRKGRVDWTTVVKNFTFYLANKSKPTTEQPKGYDSTKDIMSPDYIMPKSETSFEDVIWICYDIEKALPTLENFKATKEYFLSKYPTKQSEVENYEHSELFRQRFSESGQAEFNAALAANGRGHSKTQNQMPVPS